jgi:predicted small metal-binding protein
MAKVLKCRDVGVDCDFVARGKDEDEVIRSAKDHARKDHGIDQITEDYVEAWRRKIKDEK